MTYEPLRQATSTLYECSRCHRPASWWWCWVELDANPFLLTRRGGMHLKRSQCCGERVIDLGLQPVPGLYHGAVTLNDARGGVAP